MPITADEIIDRRRLRKKLSFWRIATFLVLAAAMISLIFYSGKDTFLSGKNSDHIARVNIEGVITNDKPMLDLLKKLEDDDKVAGVILKISSPGGSTIGGEAAFEAIRSLAEKKPVVSSIGTLAASAGYMVASASDHIVARRSSIVGSIGVLFQYADASELLKKIGVKVNAVKSSPLKAEPSPFSPASEEAVAMIDRMVQDSYQWFVGLVVERRSISRAKVLTLADGSIFTGAQSLENGLIDEIGGEDKAVDWLKKQRGLDENLKIIDRKPKRPGDSLFGNPAAVQRLAAYFGIELKSNEAKAIEKTLRQRLLLDGLVSIWQVS